MHRTCPLFGDLGPRRLTNPTFFLPAGQERVCGRELRVWTGFVACGPQKRKEMLRLEGQQQRASRPSLLRGWRRRTWVHGTFAPVCGLAPPKHRETPPALLASHGASVSGMASPSPRLPCPVSTHVVSIRSGNPRARLSQVVNFPSHKEIKSQGQKMFSF